MPKTHHDPAPLGRFAFCSLVGIVALALVGCPPPPTVVPETRVWRTLVLPQPPPPPPPVVAKPPKKATVTILPRSSWAFDQPIASRLEPMGRAYRLTIHHEGMGVETVESIDTVKGQLRKIEAAHKRLGWGDVGYHYIIDVNGRVWEGRPIKYQGAHAGNGTVNKGNIGVVLLGNFDLQRPSAASLASLRSLTEFLMSEYSISVANIYTHNEIRLKFGLSATDCPGKNLQREVDAMRKRLPR